MLRLASIVLALVACRSSRDEARPAPADDCQVFVDRAWRLLPELAPTKLTPGEFLAGCRSQAGKGGANPSLKCIAAATDEAGVRRCLTGAQEALSQEAVDRFAAGVFAAAAEALVIRYAARTDDAAAMANPTYFHIVEDERLFVVTEAVDPAESKRAAEALSPYPPAGCTGSGEAQLACAVDRVKGASSIAAVVVADREAYVVTSGDVGVLHRRGTALSPIRRATLRLASGDTLVLASRGLRAAADDAAILRATPDRASPVATLEAGLAALHADVARVPGRRPFNTILVHLVSQSGLEGSGSR